LSERIVASSSLSPTHEILNVCTVGTLSPYHTYGSQRPSHDSRIIMSDENVTLLLSMSNGSGTDASQRVTSVADQVHGIAKLAFAHLVNDIYAPVLIALQPVLITTLGYSYFQAALLPVMHSLISSILPPV